MTIEALLEAQNAKFDTLISLFQRFVPAANDDAPPAEKPAAADPFGGGGGDNAPAAAGASAAAEPPKRGRGRPAKGEQVVVATQAAPAQVAATTEPVVQAASDFLSLPGEKPAAVALTIQDVRAALAVYQAYNDTPKAVALFKTASGGAETLAQLKPDKFEAVFKAALPAGKLSFDDVRLILTKTQERKAGAGLEVLKNTGGVDQLPKLAVEKFVAVINAAQAVQ